MLGKVVTDNARSFILLQQFWAAALNFLIS